MRDWMAGILFFCVFVVVMYVWMNVVPDPIFYLETTTIYEVR